MVKCAHGLASPGRALLWAGVFYICARARITHHDTLVNIQKTKLDDWQVLCCITPFWPVLSTGKLSPFVGKPVFR